MEKSIHQLRARLNADARQKPFQGMAFDTGNLKSPPPQSTMADMPRFQKPGLFRKAFTTPSP